MKKLAVVAAALMAAGTWNSAWGSGLAPIQMQGDYIWTAVGTAGSLGMGGATSPGLIHDPTGDGDFDPLTDYITPGSPFEGFSVSVGEDTTRSTGPGRMVYSNNNTGTAAITPVSIEDISAASTYDHHVRWVGEVSSQFRVTHEFYFNDGDERINIRTQILALSALDSVLFQRIVDPDPDVGAYGEYDTTNTRGYDSNNDGDFTDPRDIPPSNWVFSEGLGTGRTLSLTSTSAIPHNTSVDEDWSDDPADTLTGTDDGDGDNSIALAFDIGDMTPDQVAELLYAYVMGATLEDIVTPGGAITTKPPIQNLVNNGMRAIDAELSRRGRGRRAIEGGNLGQSAGWETWARQIGAWFDRNDEDGLPGYDGDMRHTLMGMERACGRTAYGFAFGTGIIRMDTDDNQTSDSQMHTASLYGSWNGDNGYINTGFTYAYNDIEETYADRGAEAEFHAHAYGIHLNGGREYAITEWLSAYPEAGLRLTYFDQESYNEGNTGGREVDGYEKWFQETSLGVSLVGTKVVSKNLTLRPEATAAWVYEFNNDMDEVGFVGPGAARGNHIMMGPEESIIHTSVGMTATFKERYQFGVDVMYDFTASSATMGFGGHFGFEF